MGLTLREHCQRRKSSMEGVRTHYEEEWRQIARFAQPSRSRFLATDKDRGTQRRFWNKRLFDPHGIEAFRTLTNGMTSGLTSASRPWFTLRLPDEALNEQEEVRTWLSDVETAMYAFLAQTNFYGAVKAGYGEMGLFGTEACVMVEHRTAGAVCHSLTAGEYWIAMSDAMVPDTLMRMCPMSARQVVQTFGKDAPQTVIDSYERADSERVIELYQLIEPNADYTPDNIGSKPWRSVYWDPARNNANENFGILREKGYEEQPFWAPRWDVAGGDTYGVSPGMEALPALRELQMQAKRRNEAIDFMVKPEMIVKAGMRLTGEPGRKVSAASVDKDGVLVPYQMPYQAVEAIGGEIDKCRQQIDGLSFADLFNAIGGILPRAPDALRDVEINVEFVSILTQMQRAVGVGQIERAVGFVGNLAAASPDALDKLDIDELVDEYTSRIGTPAKIIRSDAEVEKIRQNRQAQQAQAQAAAAMPAAKDGADAARLLSETSAGGKPLLDTLMGT
jgi:hypothetical protein